MCGEYSTSKRNFQMAKQETKRRKKQKDIFPPEAVQATIEEERRRTTALNLLESRGRTERAKKLLELKMAAGETFCGVVRKGQKEQEFTIVEIKLDEAVVVVSDINGRRFDVSIFHPMFKQALEK